MEALYECWMGAIGGFGFHGVTMTHITVLKSMKQSFHGTGGLYTIASKRGRKEFIMNFSNMTCGQLIEVERALRSLDDDINTVYHDTMYRGEAGVKRNMALDVCGANRMQIKAMIDLANDEYDSRYPM